MKTAFQINAQMKMDRLRLNFSMKLPGLNIWPLYELSQNFEDSEMVFCFKNCLDILHHTVRKKCSRDGDKLLKFKAEGQKFANFCRSLEQFIWIMKEINSSFRRKNLYITTLIIQLEINGI